LAGGGLVVSFIGVVGLLSTQSRAKLRRPHAGVYVLLIVAVAFHVFQNLRMMSADFALGWFLWALLPYGLVLALSFFEGTWHHPGFPDTFDRWDDDIGGVQCKGSDTARSSSARL
jgi:hypothetical protein